MNNAAANDLLGDIPDKAPKTDRNQVAPFSHSCGLDGCNDEATVAMVQVLGPAGRHMTGFFSEYGYTKKGRTDEDARKWLLRDGYQFVGWVTRCAFHYAADAARAGRSANKKLPKDKMYPPPKTDEERMEYVDVLRSMTKNIGKPMPGANP
ncbi:MAG: hypothetical protein RPU61_14570 [Candidatus Sedimenticola sp. (ex Thyasira tokunagai)]